MDLSSYFKSVLDQDRTPIVLCDINHKIIYMNQVAIERYEYEGGAELLGENLLDCHDESSIILINKVLDWFKESTKNNIIHTFYNDEENKDVYMIALRDNECNLIGYYEKHEYRNIDKEKFYNFNK